MQSLEAFQQALKRISARTHGQLPDVRSVMGRQLTYLKDSSAMALLPHQKAKVLQDHDPDSPTYTQFYFMVGIDTCLLYTI